jgi:hypothetical protein
MISDWMRTLGGDLDQGAFRWYGKTTASTLVLEAPKHSGISLKQTQWLPDDGMLNRGTALNRIHFITRSRRQEASPETMRGAAGKMMNLPHYRDASPHECGSTTRAERRHPGLVQRS